MSYDWKPWEGNKNIRTLAIDGRHYVAKNVFVSGGWQLCELDAPEGFVVAVVANDINWNEIDTALQQYLGGA